MSDVTSIEIRSGVNEAGKGFCTVVVMTSDKQILLGQLDPETVRGMALDWLSAAEAAESDSIVYRIFTELDMPPEAIGKFLVDMRDRRE